MEIEVHQNHTGSDLSIRMPRHIKPFTEFYIRFLQHVSEWEPMVHAIEATPGHYQREKLFLYSFFIFLGLCYFFKVSFLLFLFVWTIRQWLMVELTGLQILLLWIWHNTYGRQVAFCLSLIQRTVSTVLIFRIVNSWYEFFRQQRL